MPPVNKQSPEIYTDIDKNSIEYQRDLELEEKKIEEQVNKEIEIKATQQHIESWFHIDTFDSEVEQLQKKIEANQISKEEANKLYDEITKKYDKASTIEKVFHSTGMRDKVTDKRNIKNTLLWAWWAVAVGWVASKWKSWFGKKDKKETNSEPSGSDKKEETNKSSDTKEKKSRWQRNKWWIVWGTLWAGWLAWLWYFFRDKLYKIPLIWQYLDKLYNKKLEFKEAFHYVKWNVLAKANESHLTNNMKLECDEQRGTINAFGREYKVNLQEKTIDGLKIKFSNYEDLITTIIIIWAAQDTFTGACISDNPFSISQWWGDIEAHIDPNKKTDLVSAKWPIPIWLLTGWALWATLGWIAGFYTWNIPGALIGTAWGGVAGAAAWDAFLDRNDTLSRICPTLNDELHKKKLVSYLNSMWWWRQWDVNDIEDLAKTQNEKINKKFVTVFDKIRDTIDPHDDNRTKREVERMANGGITNYKNYDNIFELTTWGKKSYMEVEWDTNWEIQSVKVEDLNITFTWDNAIEQAIRTANFINKCEKELAGKWDQADAFEYRDGITVSTLWKKWLYFDESWSAFDRKLSEEHIQKEIPFLLEWDNMNIFIDWLNTRDGGWSSLWTNTTWTGRTNMYLKLLEKNSTSK